MLGRGIANAELLFGAVAAVRTQPGDVLFTLGLPKGSDHLYPENPATLL